MRALVDGGRVVWWFQLWFQRPDLIPVGMYQYPQVPDRSTVIMCDGKSKNRKVFKSCTPCTVYSTNRRIYPPTVARGVDRQWGNRICESSIFGNSARKCRSRGSDVMQFRSRMTTFYNCYSSRSKVQYSTVHMYLFTIHTKFRRTSYPMGKCLAMRSLGCFFNHILARGTPA